MEDVLNEELQVINSLRKKLHMYERDRTAE